VAQWFFLKERFIAPINIESYMIVTKLFLNYNQFTTISYNYIDDCDSSKLRQWKLIHNIKKHCIQPVAKLSAGIAVLDTTSVGRIVKSVRWQSQRITMDLYPYFPHLVPDLGAIHYKRPAGPCSTFLWTQVTLNYIYVYIVTPYAVWKSTE
jgi:hypothetical protein